MSMIIYHSIPPTGDARLVEPWLRKFWEEAGPQSRMVFGADMLELEKEPSIAQFNDRVRKQVKQMDVRVPYLERLSFPLPRYLRSGKEPRSRGEEQFIDHVMNRVLHHDPSVPWIGNILIREEEAGNNTALILFHDLNIDNKAVAQLSGEPDLTKLADESEARLERIWQDVAMDVMPLEVVVQQQAQFRIDGRGGLAHVLKNAYTELHQDSSAKVIAEKIAAYQTRKQRQAEGRPYMIPLYDPKPPGRVTRTYTTNFVRDEERDLRARYRVLSDTPIDPLEEDEEALAERIKAQHDLTEEQQAAFDHIIRRPKRVNGVNGYAGAGKSRLMKAVYDFYDHRTRGNIICLSPTNAVAADMRQKQFLDTRTLHKFILQYGNAKERGYASILGKVQKDTMLMIDEAYMIDNEMMDKILSISEMSGCSILFFGSDQQLPSIQRGGQYKVFAQLDDYPVLTEIMRQQDPEYLEATRTLSNDYTTRGMAQALRLLHDKGWINFSSTREEAKQKLLTDWAEATKETVLDAFTVAYTNRDVDDLNARMQAILDEREEFGHGIDVEVMRDRSGFVTAKDITISESEDSIKPGTLLILKKTDKERKLYNGTLWWVKELREDEDGNPEHTELVLRDEDGKEVTFHPVEFPWFDYGYAATVHRTQGLTVNKIFYLATNMATMKLAYVAITRGRDEAKIYANDQDLRIDRNSAQTEQELLETRLRRLAVTLSTQDDDEPASTLKMFYPQEPEPPFKTVGEALTNYTPPNFG